MKTNMNEENKNMETTEESELEKYKRQSEEYLDGWKRAKADYLNLKKDMESQGKEIKEWMSKIFLLPVLDIMDNFDKAFNNVPPNLEKEVWVQGIGGIRKQFEDFLKMNGVESIKVLGEKFDPLKHEAVESAEGGESGNISEELRKGYLRNGEVLRPAKVKIYK